MARQLEQLSLKEQHEVCAQPPRRIVLLLPAICAPRCPCSLAPARPLPPAAGHLQPHQCRHPGQAGAASVPRNIGMIHSCLPQPCRGPSGPRGGAELVECLAAAFCSGPCSLHMPLSASYFGVLNSSPGCLPQRAAPFPVYNVCLGFLPVPLFQPLSASRPPPCIFLATSSLPPMPTKAL